MSTNSLSPYKHARAAQMLPIIPWFQAKPWMIPLPFFDTELPIQPFGLLVATGVFLGAHVAERRGQRVGIAPHIVSDLIAHVVLTGFIFGHMFDAVFYHPDVLAEDPLYLLKFWDGLSSFGGFFGAVLGGFIWKARRKLSFLAVGDPITFGFPVGWLFGRTGCFVVHDHPGKPTDFFLGVGPYEIGQPPYVTRHDLGFYEVLWSAGIIILFWAIAKYGKPRRGLFFALLPLLYTPVRFFLDYLRIPDLQGGDPRYFGLTAAQYSAVFLGIVSATLLYRVQKLPEPTIPDWAAWPPKKTAKTEASKNNPSSKVASSSKVLRKKSK